MHKDAREHRRRSIILTEVIFLKGIVAFCAVMLPLTGCATVKRPMPADAGVVLPGRIAALPIVNLSNSPAPLAAIRREFSDKLRGQGFDVMEEAELERFMERIRIRDTGGLGSVNARAFKEDAGVSGVLITSLELYKASDPPKLALAARLVSTGDNPEILWADGVSLAGDDAPGLLGLGLIDNVKILLNQATMSLVGSLVKYASGLEGDQKDPGSRFGPKISYVAKTVGVALREVVVDFALKQSSGEEGATSAKIDVGLSAASGKPVTVEYAVTGGTAVLGKNYDLKDGSLTFKPGETVKTMEIGIKDNGMNEPDRTIEVSLRNPKGAVLGGTAVHTYTIMDSDPEPAVTFTVASQQVKENAGSVTIGVELSAVSGWDVAVPFMVSGTAKTPGNYTITPGPVVIKAGERSASITVQVADNGSERGRQDRGGEHGGADARGAGEDDHEHRDHREHRSRACGDVHRGKPAGEGERGERRPSGWSFRRCRAGT